MKFITLFGNGSSSTLEIQGHSQIQCWIDSPTEYQYENVFYDFLRQETAFVFII